MIQRKWNPKPQQLHFRGTWAGIHLSAKRPSNLSCKKSQCLCGFGCIFSAKGLSMAYRNGVPH
jgi:hypothetical protein